jgi:hypothetical protein
LPVQFPSIYSSVLASCRFMYPSVATRNPCEGSVKDQASKCSNADPNKFCQSKQIKFILQKGTHIMVDFKIIKSYAGVYRTVVNQLDITVQCTRQAGRRANPCLKNFFKCKQRWFSISNHITLP